MDHFCFQLFMNIRAIFYGGSEYSDIGLYTIQQTVAIIYPNIVSIHSKRTSQPSSCSKVC